MEVAPAEGLPEPLADHDHEFDGSNNLLESFTWGPAGLLGATDYRSGSPVTYTTVADATGDIVELLDYANYTWQGPQTVTAPEGTVTTYTYAGWGAIQTATTGTVTETFAYDAAGTSSRRPTPARPRAGARSPRPPARIGTRWGE